MVKNRVHVHAGIFLFVIIIGMLNLKQCLKSYRYQILERIKVVVLLFLFVLGYFTLENLLLKRMVFKIFNF